jgi:hypothetical protein
MMFLQRSEQLILMSEDPPLSKIKSDLWVICFCETGPAAFAGVGIVQNAVRHFAAQQGMAKTADLDSQLWSGL